jgi:glycosyltransferase involved in cell wall biosynthesis
VTLALAHHLSENSPFLRTGRPLRWSRLMIGHRRQRWQRMRIAVDGRVMQDSYHGIGRHTFELVQRMADHDIELIVVRDPSRPGRLDVDGLARHPSVRLVDLAVPVVSPVAQPRWPRLLAAAAPDVLLVPYHLATPWIHRRVPTVAFVHDCIFETNPSYAPGGRRFSFAYELATRLALRRATAVATVSQATRQELRRVYGIVLADDAVVPHGVGEQFLALASAPREARPGDRHGRYVLHVGIHRPHKNHPVLIAAFAEVARVLPDVQLVLVGQVDPRFTSSVAEMIQTYGLTGRVHIRTDVDDDELLRLYRGAAAFAFPSLVEGFGLPVLEAMAAGVPTVTSDAAAVVEAANGASVVVPAGDIGAWSGALVHVLSDASFAAELVARGRHVAGQNTWERAANDTLQLLHRVATGQAERRDG